MAAQASAKKAPQAAEKEDPSVPKWYAPDGSPIHVTLPDGRRCIIGIEPRPIPPAFYRAAQRAGAFADSMPTKAQMRGPEVPPGADPLGRVRLIEGMVRKAYQDTSGSEEFENAFTPNGVPDIKWLSAKLGFQITASERDLAWAVVSKEPDEPVED